MKYILIPLLVVCLSACDYKDVKTVGMDTGIFLTRIIVIDSCEYIHQPSGNSSDLLIHKGNCKFCRERNYNINNNEKETTHKNKKSTRNSIRVDQ